MTTCPHHLLLAMGTADVAFAPKARAVGIGTLAALVDAHARRLTLQERIGDGVVDDIEAVLAPSWVACKVSLAHGCLVARGERAVGSRVETLAVRGADVSAAHAAVGWGKP
jgi:GTP cyclohydrolase I